MPFPRPRLTALLAESALTSVELVVAPPGYGKTTVLRAYAATDPGTAIVSLPEQADLEAFVRGVVGAAAPTAQRAIGALFADPQARGFEDGVVEWLVGRLRGFQGSLIVDDLHRAAADERVARVLSATIAATIGRVRWIVASREAPRLPMGAWIARGWMGLPVTSEDLRFNVEEAAGLAEHVGVAVAPDDLQRIVDDTLGWPIGLRLALGLVARKRGAVQTRMQTREALFALIDDEIWQPLGAMFQQLISAAALVPAPAISTLIAAGYADARALMASVFARVPFVQPIDDDTFAIHDLFREFVTTRAPQQSVGIAAGIGAALVNSGNAADGLRILIAAGDAGQIASALARHAFDLLETGHRGTVNEALALLHERGLGDTGIALAIRGTLALSDGSGANSAHLLERALKQGVPPEMRAEVARRLAISFGNRGLTNDALAVLAPLAGDATLAPEDRLENEALGLVLRTAAPAGERSEFVTQIANLERRLASAPAPAQVRILQRLASAAYYCGDIETAERLANDCVLLATELGMDTFAALAYGTLYSAAGAAGADAMRARSFARAQADAAERAANTALRIFALRAQFVIATEGGAFSEAELIEAKLGGLADARSYRDTVLFRQARALRYVAADDLDKAESTLRTIPASALSNAERAYRDAFLAVILLLRGKRDEAEAALMPGLLHDASHDFHSHLHLTYAYAYRGLAYWALDRPAQARRAFAFTSSDINARDQVLIDSLKAFGSLPHPLPNDGILRTIGETMQRAGFGAYLDVLRRLAARDANDAELSAAEIETLRVFDRFGGRAVDVAKALGKSKYTVQNQIQSAIKKLGCSGRAEALAYARQRGWLDTTTS
jgi:ATP/maltotriose-dependent transcriptional regulator MalT/DNA-binding CsgD family transcriptional regulator